MPEAHGEYRTKRVILEIYDVMAEAIRTGTLYQTRLYLVMRAHHQEPPAWPAGAFRGCLL